MSITDELREYALGWDKRNRVRLELTAIADRIDAEHERELLNERNIGFNAGFDEGFASADDWLAQHEDAMAEHGLVRLPKDADGEYIHIGDRMDFSKNVRNLTVLGIGTVDGGCSLGVFVREGDDYVWYNAHFLRHYHAPTVEDVLTELEGMRGNGATYEDVVTRCAELAEMLRGLLAGEDE